jgi:hypothetical protein
MKGPQMKHALIAAALVASVLISSVIPTSAAGGNPGIVPPQCNLTQTKTDHPNWYRDGGFCSPTKWVEEFGHGGPPCPWDI